MPDCTECMDCGIDGKGETCDCAAGRAWAKSREADRHPYRHHGPAVHGSKLVDYLISEQSLREDRPEMFEDEK